jgi:hypothetical protein
LLLKFNDAPNLGKWEEDYVLGVAVDTPANIAIPALYAINEPVAAAQSLIGARLTMLGSGPTLVWAVLSSTGLPPDGDAIVMGATAGIPRGSESPLGVCNEAGDGIQWRLQTATRRHAYRKTLGLRDSDIVGELPTVSMPGLYTAGGTALPVPVTGLTAAAQYLAYFQALMQFTYRAQWDKPTPGQWTIEPWLTIGYRKTISTRLVSIPFGLYPRHRP